MIKFNKNNIKELKNLLYNSYIHDAKLKNIEYKCAEDCLNIQLFNPIFNANIDIIFCKIGLLLAVDDKKFGSNTTINSLTVEEDFSYLQHHFKTNNEHLDDSLYLLIQMFSGKELHIVSKEVFVEQDRAGDTSLS